ncbi:hypothetical protein ACIBSV_08365 [Embleya sp. NPDC050154]|uniref:hypothetical protein n=1 Tax=Embleya sp. NPDC050154 TaxID=3363988 RepID=UPI003797F2FF
MMMHALRRTIGDDAFFGTLRQWQREHRYGNSSRPRFEALAKKISARPARTGFFDAWAHGTTAPQDQYLYPGSLGAVAPGANGHPRYTEVLERPPARSRVDRLRAGLRHGCEGVLAPDRRGAITDVDAAGEAGFVTLGPGAGTSARCRRRRS